VALFNVVYSLKLTGADVIKLICNYTPKLPIDVVMLYRNITV